MSRQPRPLTKLGDCRRPSDIGFGHRPSDIGTGPGYRGAGRAIEHRLASLRGRMEGVELFNQSIGAVG